MTITSRAAVLKDPGHLDRRTLLQNGLTLTAAGAVGLAGCSTNPGENPSPTASAPAVSNDLLESPLLTAQVDTGELPPLAERLPDNPVVIEPLDGVGQYGGSLRYASLADSVTPLITHAAAGFLEWDFEGTELLPSIAESFEANEDSTVYTITIREGLRWSDGEPYDKDDIDFAMLHFASDQVLMPAAPYWFSDANQEVPTYEWVGDRTFTLTFGTPNPLFPKYMAHTAIGYQFMKPAHYLKEFHAEFIGEDEADALAKKAGFDGWNLYWYDRANIWTNPDVPVLGAYRVVSPSTGSGTATLERNPFYFKTDADGRQLPYIDEISVQVLGQEALDLRSANGEIDLLANGLAFSGAQLLQENAASNDYQLARWQNSGGTAALCPNLSHKDPALREIFADVRFRAALSHAINRENVNQALMNGIGVVRQPIASDGTEYAVAGAGETFIEYDPAKAEELLDEIGMTKQGQWRTLPDGSHFEPVIIYVESNSQVPLSDAFHMVVQDFAAVGLKVLTKSIDNTLYGQLRSSNDFDIDGTLAPSDFMDLESVWWIPTAGNSHTAPGYGLWYASQGETGMEPTEEMKQLMDNWDALRTATTQEGRIAAGKEIVQQHKDNVYMIGIVRPPFQPVVVTNRTHNVLPEGLYSFATGREGITKTEQLWLG